MCGIAGIVSASDTDRFDGGLRSALRALSHRGPDDFGALAWSRARGVVYHGRPKGAIGPGEVIFLHLRLAILDLSPAGWQPMGLPDGSAYVTLNGEIYNYLELREELEAKGHRFQTQSDTEVVLHAYREWGMGMLSRFIGMFAFALLDVGQRKVFLARDPFGIKPLFYVCLPDALAFASETKPLLEMPGVSRRANLSKVCEYARFGSTDGDPETLIEGVFQLAPAHYAELSIDQPQVPRLTRYWKLPLDRTCDLSFTDAAEELRDLFLESVKLHSRSDAPYGATLSGGIDSSSVVLAMREVLPSHVKFPVFSFIADDAGLSEEIWVDEVARRGGLSVEKIRLSGEDLRKDLQSLLEGQQEPFGSTSIYAQYKIFERVQASGVKVTLDGQGADELLAGYRPYLGARLASLVHDRQWGEALDFFYRSAQQQGAGPKQNALYALNYLVSSDTKARFARLVGKESVPSWFDKAWLQSRGVSVSHADHSSAPGLRQALAHSLTRTGIPHLLRYQDRNSMRFGVESRVPFLNVKLVEFLFSLPESYLIAKDGTSKAVFREAMRGIVPDAILDRKDKIGFATPEGEWLRDSTWVSGVFNDPAFSRTLPFLDTKQVRAQWNAFQKTGKNFDWRFWRWINLAAWTRQFEVVYS